MAMLCKRCRSGHKEANKIGFTYLGFFYDFPKIWSKGIQRGRIYLLNRPQKLSTIHNDALRTTFPFTQMSPAAGRVRRRQGRVGGDQQAA